MDKKPGNIYDALECYHPGELDGENSADQVWSEQLQQDEVLAVQFEKSQVLDRQLQEAFAQVPVVEGLQERLHLAINEAVVVRELVSEPCLETEAPNAVVNPSTDETPSQGTLGTLLRWGALAAAILVAVGLWRQAGHQQPLSPGMLAGQATEWTSQVMAGDHEWQQVESGLPETHPVDSHVMPPVQRWSRVRTSIDSRAVAYDCSSVKTGRLVLFVMRTNEQYELPQVALQELPGSGALTVGAWQDGDLLYVMVGRRNGPSLHRYIRQRLLGFRKRVARWAV